MRLFQHFLTSYIYFKYIFGVTFPIGFIVSIDFFFFLTIYKQKKLNKIEITKLYVFLFNNTIKPQLHALILYTLCLVYQAKEKKCKKNKTL